MIPVSDYTIVRCVIMQIKQKKPIMQFNYI